MVVRCCGAPRVRVGQDVTAMVLDQGVREEKEAREFNREERSRFERLRPKTRQDSSNDYIMKHHMHYNHGRVGRM